MVKLGFKPRQSGSRKTGLGHSTVLPLKVIEIPKEPYKGKGYILSMWIPESIISTTALPPLPNTLLPYSSLLTPGKSGHANFLLETFSIVVYYPPRPHFLVMYKKPLVV